MGAEPGEGLLAAAEALEDVVHAVFRNGVGAINRPCDFCRDRLAGGGGGIDATDLEFLGHHLLENHPEPTRGDFLWV